MKVGCGGHGGKSGAMQMQTRQHGLDRRAQFKPPFGLLWLVPSRLSEVKQQDAGRKQERFEWQNHVAFGDESEGFLYRSDRMRLILSMLQQIREIQLPERL